MIAFDPSLAASPAALPAYGRGAAGLRADGSGNANAAAAAPATAAESTVVSLGQSSQGGQGGQSANADWQGGYGSLGQVASASGKAQGKGSSGQLSPDEQRQVEKLKETDRKVRAHEQAHMAAGGSLVQGGASYSYQKGPDGQMYAVGGEVSIDTSPGRTPEETLAKAQQVRAAALAPSDPSPQDRRVAAAVGQMESKARAEQASQAAAGENKSGETGGAVSASTSKGNDGARAGANAVDSVGGGNAAAGAVAERSAEGGAASAASAVAGYLGLTGRGASATAVASRINLFA